MATTNITFVVPTTKVWTLVSALAQFYGWPATPLDKTNEANMSAFVHQKIAAEMKARAQSILLQRAQQAALATVVTPTAPTVT